MAPIFIKQSAVGRRLEDCTWQEIDQMSEIGGANGYWHVGDKKTVTLSGEVNGTFDVRIADFDFYDKTDGSGKAGIVFAFEKNVIEDAHVNYGQNYSWYYPNNKDIDMLGDEIKKIRDSMPEELLSVIKKVNAACSMGSTGLRVGGGAAGVYAPGSSDVDANKNADIFPPSYAEVMNGGYFTRNYWYNHSNKTGKKVEEGRALELFKHDKSDNLKDTALDKGGRGFLRTVYSTWQGHEPGYIYIKTFEINSEQKIVIKDVSLNARFYSDSSRDVRCVGTGGTYGLCPMFCV